MIHKLNFFNKSALILSGMLAMGIMACNSDNTNDKQSINSSNPADSIANVPGTGNDVKAGSKADNPKKTARKGRASIAKSTSENNMSTKMSKDKYGVYTNPEVMPSYPGGNDALTQYIEDNVDYSQQAIDQNVTGVTTVSFVVDEKGNVSDVKEVGPAVGGGLDEATVKAIGQMPKWAPAKVNGKNVKARVNLPINFQIQE